MPTVPEIITESIFEATGARRCTMAKAVVHVDSSQPHLEETVSRIERFLAGDTGIWLAISG